MWVRVTALAASLVGVAVGVGMLNVPAGVVVGSAALGVWALLADDGVPPRTPGATRGRRP